MSSSRALQAFIASVDAPIHSPEQLKSFDLTSLTAIRPDERDDAVALIAGLLDEGRDDPRLAEALATLATDEAWSSLARALERGCSITAITAAHYLYAQRESQPAQALLIECCGADDPQLRGAALRTLGLLEIPDSAPLVAALDDPAPSVRGAALSALFIRYKLDRWDNIIGSKTYTLSLGVMSQIEPLRADAVASLREIIAQLDAGHSAEELELDAVDRGASEGLVDLWDAVDDPNAELSAATIEALAPHERDYAVEYLSRALERGDQRARAPMSALGTRRAALALAATG